MSDAKKAYDRACLITGTLLIVILPITVIVGIWTGEWRPTATLAILILAGAGFVIGAKLLVSEEEKAKL